MVVVDEAAPVDEADRLRAQVYALLAQMLARPPSAELLETVAGVRGDGSGLGDAFDRLARACAQADPRAAEREYNALFIGVDRGELVPYASYYRTGFLNDRPLARVRQDLQALGVERAPGVSEPEDHIASLCDVMAGLIIGAYGRAAPLPVQKRFHDRHLAPWADRFFSDLEGAANASLYRPLGSIGRLFLEIEGQAFALTNDNGEDRS